MLADDSQFTLKATTWITM